MRVWKKNFWLLSLHWKLELTRISVGYHRRVPNGISVNIQINFDKSPYSFRCKQFRISIINRVVDSGLICSFGLSALPPFISDNVKRLQCVFSTDNFFNSITDFWLFNLRSVRWKQRFGTITSRIAGRKERETLHSWVSLLLDSQHFHLRYFGPVDFLVFLGFLMTGFSSTSTFSLSEPLEIVISCDIVGLFDFWFLLHFKTSRMHRFVCCWDITHASRTDRWKAKCQTIWP